LIVSSVCIAALSRLIAGQAALEAAEAALQQVAARLTLLQGGPDGSCRAILLPPEFD
jgi:hypothetical protein